MNRLADRPGHRRGLLAALALSLLAAAPNLARAGDTTQAAADERTPNMIWGHTQNHTPKNFKRLEEWRARVFKVGPYADAKSRLETEMRAELPLDQVDNARAMMDALANDEEAAAKVFGKNNRLVKLDMRPRKIWDIDLDTTDGRLAAAGATLRIRIEGGTAQINYKPPGGHYFVEGLKIGVEGGITIQADKTGKLPTETLAFFANSRLSDNPLRELKKQFPGLDVADFFFEQLHLKQQRQIYEVQHYDHRSKMWVRRSEASVDRVVAREAGNQGLQIEFGRVELEGDHVSAQLSPQQLAAMAANPWRGPHKAKDAYNTAFIRSKDVREIRRFAKGVAEHLAPLGLKVVKGSKYTFSRDALAALGATFTKGRNMLKGIRRTRPSDGSPVRASKNSVRKAMAKANARR